MMVQTTRNGPTQSHSPKRMRPHTLLVKKNNDVNENAPLRRNLLMSTTASRNHHVNLVREDAVVVVAVDVVEVDVEILVSVVDVVVVVVMLLVDVVAEAKVPMVPPSLSTTSLHSPVSELRVTTTPKSPSRSRLEL